METNRLWVCSHRRAGKVSLSVMVFPWDLLTINTLQINTNPVFFKSWLEVNLPVLHSDLKKKKKSENAGWLSSHKLYRSRWW